MLSRRARGWLIFASIMALSLLVAPAARADEAGHRPMPPSLPGCEEAISEATTRTVFDALRALQPGDGCALDGVQTERQRMLIQWTRSGRKIEPIELLPASCAP